MKGLFIKDIKLILSNKSVFVIIVVMMALLAFSNTAVSAFVTSYISILFTMLVVTTISYDDFDRCMSFLMTLPVSRKDYVREKYLFAVTGELCGMLLSFVLNMAINLIKNSQTDLNELGFSMAVIFFMMLIFMSVLIPVQLKFGGERGRIVLVACVIGSVAAAFGFIQLIRLFNVDIDWVINTLILGNFAVAVAVFVAIAAICLFASYTLSNRIMRKREF